MQQFDQAPVEADAIESSLATIVQGSTAPSAFSVGKYIYLKHNSTLDPGLYRVKSAIAQGDTLSSSNLEQDSEGVVNALNGKLTPTNGSGVKKDIVSSTERTGYRKCGNVTVLDLHFTMGSTASQDESTSLLSGFPHATLKTRFMAYVINTTPRKLVRLTIDTDGNLTNCWDVLEQGNQIVATASYICEG